MARYFFNVHDDIDAIDLEGIELDDDAAAEREALRGARSLACEQVAQGRLDLRHFIEVLDERGRHTATVTFADAITVTM